VPLGAGVLGLDVPHHLRRGHHRLRRLRQRLRPRARCARGRVRGVVRRGDHRLRGVCRDLRPTTTNCGACGRARAPRARCARWACARCRAARAPPTARRLPRPADDNANCGACGNALPRGQVCSNGHLPVSCGAGLTDCAASAATSDRPRQLRDVRQRACAAGQVCSGGACQVSCGGGLTNCAGVCRDTQDRPAPTAAMCGRPAPAGQVCSAGAAWCRAAAGSADCAGTCRDLADRPAQLRRVRQRLRRGQVCSAGACVVSCGGGHQLLGRLPRPQTDRQLRHVRQRACPAGQVCSAAPARCRAVGHSPTARACAATCRPTTTTAAPAAALPLGPGVLGGPAGVVRRRGTTNCAGVCRDLRPTVRPRNCGACGTACAAGQVCSAACARCVVRRGAHQLLGRLPRPADRQRATAAPAATPAPRAGVLGGRVRRVVRRGPHQLLGRLPRPQTDNAQLRRLRPACAAGQVCSGGTCAVSCGAGTTNCSGVCRDLRPTAPTAAPAAAPARRAGVLRGHLRGVVRRGPHQLLGRLPRPPDRPATAAPAATPAPAGRCAPRAPARCRARRGTTNCSGVCRDLTTDNNNCGACGRACAAGQVCSRAPARCPAAAGTTNCSGVCRDLQTDNAQLRRLRPRVRRGAGVLGRAPARCRAHGPTNCSGVCRDLRPTTTTAAPAAGLRRGQVCSAGVCTVSCGAGTTNCSGVCRDLRRQRNCGACGASCASGQVCSAAPARCRARRAPPTARACAATSTDRQQQLRRLRPRLRGGQVCSAAACTVSCGAGTTNCSGVCRDLRPTTATAAPAAAAPPARRAPTRPRVCARRHVRRRRLQRRLRRTATTARATAARSTCAAATPTAARATARAPAAPPARTASAPACAPARRSRVITASRSSAAAPPSCAASPRSRSPAASATAPAPARAGNCNDCSTWRFIAWRTGNDSWDCANHTAGRTYCGHTPCGCGDNQPSPTTWDMQGCTPDLTPRRRAVRRGPPPPPPTAAPARARPPR
jgi:hypothetical protein